MGRRELFDERQARTIRRMSLGSLGGRSEQAQPPGVQAQVARASVSRPRLEVVTFVVPGGFAASASPKHRAILGGALTLVVFQANAAGTGTTTFRVLDDGVFVGSSVSVTSAVLTSERTMSDVIIAQGSMVQFDVTAWGEHDDAVMQLTMAS